MAAIPMVFLSSKKQHVYDIRAAFEHQSIPKFTINHSINHNLTFHDVLLEQQHNEIIISLHVKDTNIASCLNVNSECPHFTKYLRSALIVKILQFKLTELKQC